MQPRHRRDNCIDNQIEIWRRGIKQLQDQFSMIRDQWAAVRSLDVKDLRLSTDGHLYTCLFAVAGRDVRAVLRDGSTDEELLAFLADTWRARDDRYSELRSESASVWAPRSAPAWVPP